MLRRPIARFSTLNNVPRINKRLCATECFNKNKPDIKKSDNVKLINFQINYNKEKYDNFYKKVHYNLFSEDEEILQKRVLFGLITGSFSGAVIGGLTDDWILCIPFGVLGMIVGELSCVITPISIPIGCGVIFCTGIGFMTNKLFK